MDKFWTNKEGAKKEERRVQKKAIF